MCGILGLVGRPVDAARFRAALDTIAHRGPDAEGLHHEHVAGTDVALGHRRLAIIDLSPGGAQPMASRDGRYLTVFNGEIFNFRALRAELEAAGVELRSRSDTEVMLETYVRRGPDAFATFNGMFALAILDRQTGELVLARDHLGVKPLYYAERDGALAFASEVKALLALGHPARLNRPLVGEYLAQNWVQEPDTLFEGISKLPAGHFARYHEGRLEVRRFWDVPAGPGPVGTADWLEELGATLEDAVRLQVVADRPLGAYISGGVDSSLVTELAAREVAEMVLVSARFAGGDQAYEGVEDDGVWADRFAARHPRLKHHGLVLSADLFDVYRDLVWHLDEPIADAAAVPSYMLARDARAQGAVVMLSGMGADELFAGYSRYSALQAQQGVAALPAPLREGMLAVAAGLQRVAGGPLKRRAGHLERFLQSASGDWPLSYVPLIGAFAPGEVDALAGDGWREPYVAKQRAVLAGFEHASRLVQAQRMDLKGFLASHNLIYADKTSMAASVEVRVPLLDYRLAELAFRLPDGQRVGRGQEKVLLKRLCAERVDPRIAYRAKAGFAMPVRSWLRGSLRAEVERAFAGGPVAGLLAAGELRRLLDEHYEQGREHSGKLWTLLNLDLWMTRFEVAA